MKCKYCDTELATGLTKCPACGADVPTLPNTEDIQPQKYNFVQSPFPPKPSAKKYVLIWCAYILMLIVAFNVTSIFFTLVTWGLAFLMCKLMLNRNKLIDNYYASLDIYGNPSYLLTLREKKMAYILVSQELKSKTSDGTSLFSKSINTKKIILTLLFSICFLVCGLLFYTSAALIIFPVSVLLYVKCIYKSNIANFITKEAKKNPDTPISELIDRYTAVDTGNKKTKIPKIISFAVLSFVAILTIPAMSSSSYTTEETEGGCVITAYSPSIFDIINTDIPEEIDGMKVVKIDRAFERNPYVKQITMPDTVLYIGESAFNGCSSLKSIKLSSNIKEIGSYAFKNCSDLQRIDLPDTLTSIGGEAFKGCSSLTEISIPKGVTEIRGYSFEDCSSLRQVDLHNGITVIHAFAFRDCTSLTSIDLPDGITKIHEATFRGCTELKSIEIPEGVVRISAHAFRECDSLKTVSVPSTLKEIGSSAFRSCNNLKEIYLPYGTIVNDRAFKESPTKVYYK